MKLSGGFPCPNPASHFIDGHHFCCVHFDGYFDTTRKIAAIIRERVEADWKEQIRVELVFLAKVADMVYGIGGHC